MDNLTVKKMNLRVDTAPMIINPSERIFGTFFLSKRSDDDGCRRNAVNGYSVTDGERYARNAAIAFYFTDRIPNVYCLHGYAFPELIKLLLNPALGLVNEADGYPENIDQAHRSVVEADASSEIVIQADGRVDVEEDAAQANANEVNRDQTDVVDENKQQVGVAPGSVDLGHGRPTHNNEKNGAQSDVHLESAAVQNGSQVDVYERNSAQKNIDKGDGGEAKLDQLGSTHGCSVVDKDGAMGPDVKVDGAQSNDNELNRDQVNVTRRPISNDGNSGTRLDGYLESSVIRNGSQGNVNEIYSAQENVDKKDGGEGKTDQVHGSPTCSVIENDAAMGTDIRVDGAQDNDNKVNRNLAAVGSEVQVEGGLANDNLVKRDNLAVTSIQEEGGTRGDSDLSEGRPTHNNGRNGAAPPNVSGADGSQRNIIQRGTYWNRDPRGAGKTKKNQADEDDINFRKHKKCGK